MTLPATPEPARRRCVYARQKADCIGLLNVGDSPGLCTLLVSGCAGQAPSRAKFLAPGMEMLAKPVAMGSLAARAGNLLQDNVPQSPKIDTNSNTKTEGA